MKKRMILALVLVFALLCLACANDANDGASSSESVSVAETGTDVSAESSSRTESTSSADETSGETSTVGSASSDTSSGTFGTDSSTSSGTESGTSSNDTSSGNTSNASSNANGTSSASTSNGTESSGTGSGTSSESSKPTEGSETTTTSSGSDNPSQTAHTHKYAATIINPTCTENGYTLHTCSCGDSYKDNEAPATGHEIATYSPLRTVKESTYTEKGIHERQCLKCQEWVLDEEYDLLWAPPVNDEKVAYQRIIALQEEYPQFSVWDSDTSYKVYEFHPGGYGGGSACNGFAYMLSNAGFGMYWKFKTIKEGTFTIEDVRVGDLVYEMGPVTRHVSVVLEVYDDHIVTASGNSAGMVNWYGYMDRAYLETYCYIETRYDPEYF